MDVLNKNKQDRCDKCTGDCKMVRAYGPTPAPILIIGDQPGRWEENSGRPFSGDAGKELDKTYLSRANLERGEVRTTNVVLCKSESGKKPNDGLISSCSKFHLPQDIEECDPKIIVLMGSIACSLLPSINLEIEHGRPIRVDSTLALGTVFEQWAKSDNVWIVPMYHPASGLHATSSIQSMVEDWEYFGKWRREEIVDSPTRKKFYFCNSDKPLSYRSSGVAIDLESVNGRVWSIQVCVRQSYVAMYTTAHITLLRITDPNNPALNFLNSVMEVPIFLHNAPGDLLLLKQLGLTPYSKVMDTMQCAYHRQNLPQGLKAIGYRLFGIKMTQYQDLVIPYSKRALEYWLLNALVICEAKLRWTEFKKLKTKVREILHVSDQEKKIRWIIRHSASKETYNPWERLNDITTDIGPIVDLLGNFPTPSIEHVPMSLAVDYACTDADVTYQFKEWLFEHQNDGLKVEDCDVDK